ncbi:MAG: hypothetical protein IBX71_06940 [Candidatus Desulforudis sp.]|nr:hypothetical protein [Desulforudis sp.]
MNIGVAELMLVISYLFILAIPLLFLYFVIKWAVKQAIRELKRDGTL